MFSLRIAYNGDPWSFQVDEETGTMAERINSTEKKQITRNCRTQGPCGVHQVHSSRVQSVSFYLLHGHGAVGQQLFSFMSPE